MHRSSRTEIEPTATPFPSGRHTPFAASLLEFCADVPGVLGDERTAANTSRCGWLVAGSSLF